MSTLKDVQEYALKYYKLHAANFARSPTAVNWMSLKVAMLTHQQAQQFREYQVGNDKRLDTLLDLWRYYEPEQRNAAIVYAATGEELNKIAHATE